MVVVVEKNIRSKLAAIPDMHFETTVKLASFVQENVFAKDQFAMFLYIKGAAAPGSKSFSEINLCFR